ncbi:MAG: hypothetical protein IPF50_18580 [Proteobacteria bacterium]|nr:hypothetical protein [Pseudomonadota bacterium]
MQESYIERILKARVYDVAIESPLEPARRLSRRPGATTCCSSARTCGGPVQAAWRLQQISRDDATGAWRDLWSAGNRAQVSRARHDAAAASRR